MIIQFLYASIIIILTFCTSISFGHLPPAAEPAEIDDQLDWGEEVEGFRLSISTPKREVDAGELVQLTVTLQNIGEQEASSGGGGLNLYRFQVIMGDEEAPLTRFGRRIYDNPMLYSSRSTHRMQPNEMRSITIALNTIHDMTLRGRYQITVERPVAKREHKDDADLEMVTITSNTITIQIRTSTLPKEVNE